MKPSQYTYVNGKIVSSEKAVISVFDRGLVIGDGLFETLRAIEFVPEFFQAHYNRLKRSAARLHIPVPLKSKEMREVVYRLCKKSKLTDAVVRITLTRGPYDGGLSIQKKSKPSLIITVRPVSGLPTDLYNNGVSVCISTVSKAAASGLDATVKSTNYLANIFAKAEADERGFYEAVLLGAKGELSELSTANLFVVKNGFLLTPPVNQAILPGITRQQVIEIAKGLGLEFKETSLFKKGIRSFSEAFLTSSIRGIVPIVKIENQRVHGGKVGEITRLLQKSYEVKAKRNRMALKKNL